MKIIEPSFSIVDEINGETEVYLTKLSDIESQAIAKRVPGIAIIIKTGLVTK
jgi:hypothetical protein